MQECNFLVITMQILKTLVTTSVAISLGFIGYAPSVEALVVDTTPGNSTTYQVTELVVNGTAYSFAINTGNSYSTVTEEIGSILANAGSVFDMGPKIALYDVPIFSGFFALAPSLDISSDFYITDGFLLDAGVDGILGDDLMRNSITDTFLSSLTINPDFPIIKEGGDLFVNLTIKNADGSKQKTVKLLVDTGAQGSLLRTATAQELGLSDTTKKVNLSGAGSGKAPVKKGTVDGVGEFEFIATDSIKDVLPKGVDGILGMDIVNSRTIINTKKI